jgi:signal transduction histidine kinase
LYGLSQSKHTSTLFIIILGCIYIPLPKNPAIKEKELIVDFLNNNVSIAVECDAAKITQVIINLLSNAIKFSPIGSRIQLETIAHDKDDEGVLIVVSDEGTGIPEAEMDGVFDKFVQSSKTKTGAGGTGLGLTICREIIQGHNGNIWAENIIPKGAKFLALLPFSQKRGKNA